MCEETGHDSRPYDPIQLAKKIISENWSNYVQWVTDWFWLALVRVTCAIPLFRRSRSGGSLLQSLCAKSNCNSPSASIYWSNIFKYSTRYLILMFLLRSERCGCGIVAVSQTPCPKEKLSLRLTRGFSRPYGCSTAPSHLKKWRWSCMLQFNDDQRRE